MNLGFYIILDGKNICFNYTGFINLHIWCNFGGETQFKSIRDTYLQKQFDLSLIWLPFISLHNLSISHKSLTELLKLLYEQEQ